ncbi:type II secretion system major pseudopilin GspG [Gallaecimonas sp. GXIMD4217]|uniref:type II secretion system major pseudopilin GspG n=1 Tax=Gallaecimonas sp. GXIMD4217 TaxID=3131927 RepID=UPI00311AC3A3
MKVSTRKQRRQGGFTLLEIMVVIVILGILASMIVPNVLGNKEQADQQKVVSDIRALESSLDMFKLDNSRYPDTEQGLEALVSDPGGLRKYKEGGYIKRLPKDPWGNDYIYLNPGEQSRSGYDLYSLGADGQEGGEGVNADIGNFNLGDFQG